MTTAPCVKCQALFQYVKGVRRRKICTPCQHANSKASHRRIFDSYKLMENEGRGQDMDGLFAFAVHTEAESAAVMGVTRQAVQQATRSALVRVRRLMLEPLRIYREPPEELEFSYREMEVELRDWRAAQVAAVARALEADDAELCALAAEMGQEIEIFAAALEAGVEGQRRKRGGCKTENVI
jgi:hypothetical protein